MIESTGAISFDELTRAAPMRTSFTTMPLTEAKVCVTRRTHEPQCMPSICNVTDVKTTPPWQFDDTPANTLRNHRKVVDAGYRRLSVDL